MVDKNKDFWKCSICSLKYKKKEYASRCEKWCRKHRSCNLEITQHSVDRKKF